MHPEVVQYGPGRCPKCGMALVVKDEEQHGEMDHSSHDHSDHTDHHKMMAEDFKKRFFVILPITILVLLLTPQTQSWVGGGAFYFGDYNNSLWRQTLLRCSKERAKE